MSARNYTTCPQCGSEEKLREDYELGIREGFFDMTYTAWCYVCKWSYKKRISEKVENDIQKPV